MEKRPLIEAEDVSSKLKRALIASVLSCFRFRSQRVFASDGASRRLTWAKWIFRRSVLVVD